MAVRYLATCNSPAQKAWHKQYTLKHQPATRQTSPTPWMIPSNTASVLKKKENKIFQLEAGFLSHSPRPHPTVKNNNFLELQCRCNKARSQSSQYPDLGFQRKMHFTGLTQHKLSGFFSLQQQKIQIKSLRRQLLEIVNSGHGLSIILSSKKTVSKSDWLRSWPLWKHNYYYPLSLHIELNLIKLKSSGRGFPEIIQCIYTAVEQQSNHSQTRKIGKYCDK